MFPELLGGDGRRDASEGRSTGALIVREILGCETGRHVERGSSGGGNGAGADQRDQPECRSSSMARQEIGGDPFQRASRTVGASGGLRLTPYSSAGQAAPDKVHDLDLVAFADHCRFERGPLQHHEVVLDGHAPCVDLELGEEAGDRQGTGDLEWITVDHDFQIITPLWMTSRGIILAHRLRSDPADAGFARQSNRHGIGVDAGKKGRPLFACVRAARARMSEVVPPASSRGGGVRR